LYFGIGRFRAECAPLVGHYEFGKPRAGSARTVDFDSDVELFDGACVFAGCKQRAAPGLKRVGFPPRQTVLLEGRDRFLEMGFCHRVLCLRCSDNRRGVLDTACEPTPVLTGPDNLAATLKVRQRLEGVASVHEIRGERGPGEQFLKYVSAVHGNLERPL